MEDEGSADVDFDQHRSKFFAFIGHCVTSYQSIEDFLPKVFAPCLGGDESRNSAIFALAKGLEAKLNLISAALSSSEMSLRDSWSKLLVRIAQAAEARNQIAHARPIHHGSPITIIMSEEGVPEVIVGEGKDRMMLHKQTKSGGDRVWSSEEMREQTERNHKLFDDLIDFRIELTGKA